MADDWQTLTELTKGKPIVIERVRIRDEGIRIEGEFELPPLALLRMEDQVFIAVFIRSHGSIKEMERLFGVSYPTIKNRLNRISREFGFVEVEPVISHNEVLDRLERGEISVKEAMEELRR
jgi:hypothetical protein